MAHYEASPSLKSQGLHAHDYFEFYLHVNGGRQYCVDDTVFELKQNQLIIIPPLHMHGLVCDRYLVDYERCYLYITPETLKKCGFNKMDLCNFFEESCNNKNFTGEISSQDSQTIINLLKNIEASQNSSKNETNYFLTTYSQILNILQIAMGICSAPSEISSVNSQNAAGNSMYRILHYINQHFTEKITIQDLCSSFNMSESALSHEFRKYANKGVYEYILYKRIIKAKELLITDLNLTQIALECGFNDYSNFLRVFKKFTGCSPKNYKNKFILS